MSNKKNKSKCDGAFAMSPKAHLGGCGYPECASEENSTGAEAGIQDVINCLRTLADSERLLVWDPLSKKCLSGMDIESICANGSSVQISLSRTWAE